VHVTGPGQAKINLISSDGEPYLVYSIGIKSADMRRLMAEAWVRQSEFLREWERIHGRSI
jgi:hypothetical protein